MATVIRRTDPVVDTLATAYNALKLQIGAGALFHLDASEQTITAANSSSLATALTLVNQLLAVYQFHMADTLAHKVVGVALASYVPATDLTTAQTRANDIKAKYNTHIASTTYHYSTDAANAIAAADATNQATLDTLLNEIKTDFNLHMASAPSAKSLRVVAA